MARYYIYDAVNNKYYNGTEWIADKYWFEVELNIDDPGDLNIMKILLFHTVKVLC